MIAKDDFQCHVCQSMSLMGDEYGLAYSVRSKQFESLCILCIKAAEQICIEVKM
jgi:hypothetical protein